MVAQAMFDPSRTFYAIYDLAAFGSAESALAARKSGAYASIIAEYQASLGGTMGESLHLQPGLGATSVYL
jgi:hypothetical protein